MTRLRGPPPQYTARARELENLMMDVLRIDGSVGQLRTDLNGVRTQMGNLSLRMFNIEEARARPQRNEPPSTIGLGCANDPNSSVVSYTIRRPSNGDESDEGSQTCLAHLGAAAPPQCRAVAFACSEEGSAPGRPGYHPIDDGGIYPSPPRRRSVDLNDDRVRFSLV